MSIKSYWRGYIDGQNKNEHNTDTTVAFAKKARVLKEISTLLDKPIIESRSGYIVQVFDLDKKLPRPAKPDADYIRGFFKASGKIFGDKITITSQRLELFEEAAERILKIDLPKSLQPNKKYATRRITITGDKRRQFREFLEQEIN